MKSWLNLDHSHSDDGEKAGGERVKNGWTKSLFVYLIQKKAKYVRAKSWLREVQFFYSDFMVWYSQLDAEKVLRCFSPNDNWQLIKLEKPMNIMIMLNQLFSKINCLN